VAADWAAAAGGVDVLSDVVAVDGESGEDVDDADVVVDPVLLVLVSVSARVMLKMLLDESVTWAPSSQTAMANMGEIARSLVVPTIQEKDVAPT
jgi:hypothetical protein